MKSAITVPPYETRKALREATLAVGRSIRIAVTCQECGKTWRVSPNADPQCPKCNSVDFEVKA